MIDICDNFLSTLLDEHRKNYPGKTIDVDKMHDIVLEKLLLQARQIESKVPGFYKRTDSEEEYYFKVSENYYNTLQKKIFQSQMELEKPLFIMVFIQGMFFPKKNQSLQRSSCTMFLKFYMCSITVFLKQKAQSYLSLIEN
jgi:hypothetical protein